ncbi:hypothetical protein ACTMTJ_17735 [Phytohabitans sp. LJ34]|uniref:hypothetical protein n=1 Tax=Phytohabitans sp. LJ34 TaxID=3452217 RepID=UPI003F8A853D
MATTMPWLSGWPATRPRRRTARARAFPALPALFLARGERVLLTLHGVVATDRAIFCDGPDWTRLGWEQVTRVERHERGLLLTAWAPDLPPRTVVAAEPATPLLALARERIAWTTLLTTRVPIGGHPARVAARRQPGAGTLVWIVALAPEVTPTPAVDEELAAALARLARELS